MTQEYWKFLMFKFFSTLSFEDSIDHKQLDYNVDDMRTYRQWYTEDIQNRDTLVITVGDSWTWGDHLGNIDWNVASDDPVRLTQIFGRKLADKLATDWINLARPGCSNYWMLEKLQDIQPFIQQAQYKKIYVIVTLTEDLREAQYTRRINVNAPYQDMWSRSIGVTDFLVQVENYLLRNLEQYFSTLPNVTAYVQRAFTDIWPANSSPLLLEKSWCDVIQDNFNFKNYQKPVPFIGQMAVDPLTEKYIALNPERKLEFLDIMDRVSTRWNFLGSSTYNLKGSTCHPNPAGHELWAEYLYSKLR
jgi:hypothetical protein